MTGSFSSRWLIGGTLVLAAPLSIRTGEAVERTPPKPGVGDETTVQVAQVQRGGHGWPVIPGSSLKGVLRHWIVERLVDEQSKALIERVFGHEPRPIAGDEDRQSGRGGKADFHDAMSRWAGTTGPPVAGPLRSSTAIDRATRTAERRKLFHAEQVAAGTVFNVTISGDNLQDREVALLLAAFKGFNTRKSDLAITLGGSAGSGKGRAKWSLGEVRCMDAAALARWRAEPEPVMWHDWIRADDDCVVETGDLSTVADKLLEQRQNPAFVRLKLRLRFDGPFLVNDPWRAAEGGEDAAPDDDKGKTAPDMRPRLDHDGRPVLPGESVRGALRSQAERILRTIGRRDGDMPEIGVLFGSTERRGALEVEDFRVDQCEVVPQHFVAIDRFTGGQARGKLYMAEPAIAPVFEGALTLRLGPRPRKASEEGDEDSKAKRSREQAGLAAHGLMALVLRDVVEGDVTFGWGRSKGYGSCRGEITDLAVTGAATCTGRHHYGKMLKHCVAALHERQGGANGAG